MTRRDAERQEAIEKLGQMVKKGDTIYTILRSVSRSGMSRDISVISLDASRNQGFNDDRPTNLSYYVAKAGIGRHVERMGHNAVRVGGCGMDMGYLTVYNLACVLFCKDGYDRDAACSLRHEWL